jgi:hypothetical protein
MQVSHESIYRTLFVQSRAPCARSWRDICAPDG